MVKNHIHVYRRSRTNKNYYQCDDPECTHYIHKSRIMGKKALCRCGREFILDYETLRRAFPACPFCSGGKKSKSVQKATEIISQILEQSGEIHEINSRNVG